VPSTTTFTYTNATAGLGNSSGGTAKVSPTFAANSPSLLLDELPLTGGTAVDMPTDASKYLVIDNITIDKQDEFLTYDVTINVTSAGSPSDLVTKTLTNEMLTLNYKAGATGTADITVKATDRFGATITETFTVTVTSPNQAPAGTDGPITVTENLSYTFQQSDFGFTDNHPNSPPNTLQAVKISSLPTAGHGVLMNNGTAVTVGQFISVADITAGKFVYTPATNQSGNAVTNFTFQVQDNGGTAQGGIDTDPSAKTITINITHVNQPPVGTNGTLNTNVDTPLTLAAADFGFTDPADAVPNSFQAVKITTLPGSGSLTLSGNAVNAGDFITVTDLTAGNLKFTPGIGESGSPYATFTFQVQDDGGTANGAQNVDITPRTMTINVV
jgi:hypothetical protein